MTNKVQNVAAGFVTTFAYDVLGRPVSRNGDAFGNRVASAERGTNVSYSANSLNQYTAVDDFVPQFDDDGNQTLVKTTTGIWSVTYNGENRPIFWTNGSTNIVMSFDRMGRRVRCMEACGTITNFNRTFTYDGYLQIANRDMAAGGSQEFVWDPTEPVATRPLAWISNGSPAYYTHDGNKNVSEVVADDGEIAAHYEYAPFGAVTKQTLGIVATESGPTGKNPFRFSSEYADDSLGLAYYNYRHYDPVEGRWLCTDPVGFIDVQNLYVFTVNGATSIFDTLGLYSSLIIETHQNLVSKAFNEVLRDNGNFCFDTRERRTQIVEYLKNANARMDKDYSADEYLTMHFNLKKRDVGMDQETAIQQYLGHLTKWDSDIEKAMQDGGDGGCTEALAKIGELTHMLQDYYGHGISDTYEEGMQDSEIGYAAGDPYNPQMMPSDYAGFFRNSQHGMILLPEPGIRAPDGPKYPHLALTWNYDTGRLGQAKRVTKEAFEKYLREWCEACCEAKVPEVGNARHSSQRRNWPMAGRRY